MAYSSCLHLVYCIPAFLSGFKLNQAKSGKCRPIGRWHFALFLPAFGPLLVCESLLPSKGRLIRFRISGGRSEAHGENIWDCRFAKNVAGSSVNSSHRVPIFCFVVLHSRKCCRHNQSLDMHDLEVFVLVALGHTVAQLPCELTC